MAQVELTPHEKEISYCVDQLPVIHTEDGVCTLSLSDGKYRFVWTEGQIWNYKLFRYDEEIIDCNNVYLNLLMGLVDLYHYKEDLERQLRD